MIVHGKILIDEDEVGTFSASSEGIVAICNNGLWTPEWVLNWCRLMNKSITLTPNPDLTESSNDDD